MPNRNNSEFTIDKGIPIPKNKGIKEALRQMEVTDSLFVTGKVMAHRAAVSAYAVDTGSAFVTRKEGAGIRIWRTA